MCSHCLRASCNFFFGVPGATGLNSVRALCDVNAVAVQSPQPPCGNRTEPARLPWQDDCAISLRFHGYCTGSERQPCDSRARAVRMYNRLTIFFCPHVHQKSCVGCTITLGQRTMPVRGLCDAIYDMYTGYGLTIFKNLSNSSRNQIVEAAEPVNPHDNLTVSAQRLRDGCAERGLRAVCGLRRHIASQM